MIAIKYVLHGELIEKVNENFTMDVLIIKGKLFKNYPYAWYATDCRFQEANRPSSISFTECKIYFSAKYNPYGRKSEASVL